MLRDGKSYTTTVATNESGEQILLGNYYRGESMRILVGDGVVFEGDIFTIDDMLNDVDLWNEAYTADTILDYIDVVDVCVSAAWNGSDYYIPYVERGESPYADITLRAMYIEEDGDRVYYAYVEFSNGSPSTVEALIVVDAAVDTVDTRPSGSGSGSGVPDSGDRTCSRCFNSGEVECISCGGSGDRECPACNGDGGRQEYERAPYYGGGSLSDAGYYVWKECSSCGGDGEKDCISCGGDGQVDCPSCDN